MAKPKKQMETATATDWRSLYVLAIIAFLSSIKMGMGHNLWPYMVLMDPDVTESFYGMMLSTASVFNLIAAFFTGYISNLIAHTKPSLVAGKTLALVGSILYLLIEIAHTQRRFIFVAMEIVLGTSMGLLTVARTYISMSSTEKDRPRAISLITLSHTIGLAIGPLLMGLMTMIKYPGISLFGGLHFNLYSAPIYLLQAVLLVSIVLLIFFYDGKMRIIKVAVEEHTNNANSGNKRVLVDPTTLPKNQRYDKLAVFACLATRFLSTLGMVFGHSLSSSYMMTAFQWRGEEYVRYTAIMHVFTGLMGIGWSLAYFSGFMTGRLSERRAILIAIVMKLTFFVITYPYPIYEDTIAYQVLSVNETSDVTTIVEPGCKLAYEWCATTPRVNATLYVVAQVIFLGLSVPLMHLNLDILYSKILGQIKQGTMQAVFSISGDVLQILGPLVLTTLYQSTGPRYVWMIIIAVMSAILLVWLVTYRRLVSSSRRIQAMVDNYEIKG